MSASEHDGPGSEDSRTLSVEGGSLNSQAYRDLIGDELERRQREVADRWLQALRNVVQGSMREIFPSDDFLDHIPDMIGQVANILRHTDDALHLHNSAITRKAMQLGELRHHQNATVHQLLREYDLLAEVLEDVVREITLECDHDVAPEDSLEMMARVASAVRSILQSTVDTFVLKFHSEIEQQTQRLVAMNKLLSHELRTPLQAASLNVELIKASISRDHEIYTEIEKVESSIDQIVNQLNSVEQLTQPNRPRVENPVCQEIEIALVAQDVCDQLRGQIDKRGIDVSIGETIGKIEVETASLTLVMMNLVSNAIKYSDPDKETRQIEIVAVESDDESRTAFLVRDNGLGIPANQQNDVFKLYRRAHDALDDRHEVSGDGLGLYLVAETLRELGGRIELTSEVGVGTEVRVDLPSHVPDPDTAQSGAVDDPGGLLPGEND